MFEKLYKLSATVLLHKTEPYAKEREKYLRHLEKQGYASKTLRWYASQLLVVMNEVILKSGLNVTYDQIREAAERREQPGHYRGYLTCLNWLDFLNMRPPTMFDKLYKLPGTGPEHRAAPYAQEREKYIRYLAEQGYSLETLRRTAAVLRVVINELIMRTGFDVSHEQIKEAAERWACKPGRLQVDSSDWKKQGFLRTCTSWLDFLGTLKKPPIKPTPFSDLIDKYTDWMKNDRGFTAGTIHRCSRFIRNFLHWYGLRKKYISSLNILDIDRFLSWYGKKGLARSTLKGYVSVLKTFIRFGSRQGWCHSSLADAFQGPTIYSKEKLPGGPSREDVIRLLETTATNDPRDIRDRPILMLLAIYGMRCGEISNLRLDDIDWERDLISLRHTKNRRIRTYPLIPVVGNAIVRYIRETRPSSDYQELFLRLNAPHLPIRHSGIYHATSSRIRALGIRTPHRGPHSLRHACATYLLSKRLTMKEIGDHLGHTSISSTENYAKVDLPGLYEVAQFDAGGLL